MLLSHLTVKTVDYSLWAALTNPATWGIALVGGIALALALRAELRGD